MFDRMTSVNTENRRTSIAVMLTLDDGTTMAGEIVVSGHGDLQSYLNGDRAFYLFERSEGGPCYVSKTSIRRIDPVNAPDARQLDRARTQADRFDPFEILGIAPDAGRDDIRAAYHARVKVYHPDRIASLQLPREMIDYSAAMLSRINAAYEQLGGRTAH